MITFCIIALSIAATNGCQVPCGDTDTECYFLDGCGCVRYIGEDFQTFLAENNEEECTADPCETVLCNDGETCYATSLGATCISPGGGMYICIMLLLFFTCVQRILTIQTTVGPACGAIGDPKCKYGYECVSGTCVNPTYEDPTTAEPCILPLCLDPCPTGRCGLDQRCISQPTTQVDRPECPGCNEFVRCEPINNGKPCGKNQCADDEFCCNESCGECAPIVCVHDYILTHALTMYLPLFRVVFALKDSVRLRTHRQLRDLFNAVRRYAKLVMFAAMNRAVFALSQLICLCSNSRIFIHFSQ